MAYKRDIIPCNKEIIYDKSYAYLQQKIALKQAQGWRVKGEIKQQLNGVYACQIERDTPWVYWE